MNEPNLDDAIVGVFAFCENVIEDKGGALSLIRMLQQIEVLPAAEIPGMEALAAKAIPMFMRPTLVAIVYDLPQGVPLSIRVDHESPEGPGEVIGPVETMIAPGHTALNLVIGAQAPQPVILGWHRYYLSVNGARIARARLSVTQPA